MNTEEKARAYDEALERAKEFQKSKDGLCVLTAESIFPELRESESERIRNWLVDYFGSIKETVWIHRDITCEQILDWLEKQKEQKPKMTPRWLYRLEFKDSSCGLWYDGTGKWCFESGIGSIADCKTKNLPMDYDERYKQEGRDWFSSCSCKEDLMHWYSLEDAKELISKGFVFTRYLATEYHEYDQQTVFIKETSLYREEIDIFELFKKQPAEWSEEDEEALREVKLNFELNHDNMTPTLVGFYEKFFNKLKSLRPQSHWKPSEEQMYALAKAVTLYGGGLDSLYQDLKKLM